MITRPCRFEFSESPWSWKPHVRAVGKAPDVRDWPGTRTPTRFMGGQSVWRGCGSDWISWDEVWLFTTVTLCPTEMVTSRGVTTPAEEMVNVAPLVAGGRVVVAVV